MWGTMKRARGGRDPVEGTGNGLSATRDAGGLLDPGRRSFLAFGAAWFITAAAAVPCPAWESEDLIAPKRALVNTPGASDKGTGTGSSHAAGSLFLTFDDGPAQCTDSILDQLAFKNQKATFFVIGRHLTSKKLRASAVRALREGHELGNHSYSHPRFSEISVERAEKEIRRTHDLIEEVVRIAGVDAKRQNRFFRYPFGDPGTAYGYRAMKDLFAELGYRPAWWDVDTRDYLPGRSAKIIALMEKVRPRDVVLLHERKRTAKTLPKLLDVVDSRKMVSLPLSTFAPARVWNGPHERSPASLSHSSRRVANLDPEDIFFDFRQQR
jgi:peptidoglycan/xylan/chitin deacetylase (PgdA/CDA1 family)